MYHRIHFVAWKGDWYEDFLNLLTSLTPNTIFGLIQVKYYNLPIISLKFVGSTNSLELSSPNFNLFF